MASKALQKTNVVRLLDQAKVAYDTTTYDVSDGEIDGISVANKVGRAVEGVFKTLVTRGKTGMCYVCVIPVSESLDLKKLSSVSGEKKVEMLPVGELLQTTGYVRGGCSPIGMKKQLRTFIHQSVHDIDEITVSGGRIGLQVTLAPEVLIRMTSAEVVALTE